MWQFCNICVCDAVKLVKKRVGDSMICHSMIWCLIKYSASVRTEMQFLNKSRISASKNKTKRQTQPAVDAFCVCFVPPAEEQNQREGAGRPEPGRRVCPPRPGFLREPLRPLPQLEAPRLRVSITVYTYTIETMTTAAVNNSSVQAQVKWDPGFILYLAHLSL